MKRCLLAALVACVAMLVLVVGCAGGGGATGGRQAQGGAAEGAVSVVCTTFPSYDWVRTLVGDNSAFDVQLLIEDAVDLHNFQPSVADIARVHQADVFVYVGGESDEWVPDVLASAENPNQQSVNLLEALGSAALEEEAVEGMQAEEEDVEEGDDAEEGPDYDEHVWLSVRNAQVLVAALADELCELVPASADDIRANQEAYTQQLAELDARYGQVVGEAQRSTVLFADRFPFRYLCDDYGLSYYAAFMGCSAETEASFETIAFLANKVDELGLPYVLTIENSDGRIARTVVETSKERSAQALVMDSLQSVTGADVAAGKTYVGAMEENLAVLEQALN